MPVRLVSPDPIREAVDREDPRELLAIAAEEAKRRDRITVFLALRHLGTLCRAAFADDARTARLRFKCGEYHLEFSPAFVREYVATPSDILHLLLHEIMHRVRGDLHRPLPGGVPREAARVLSNFAADMLVNADLEEEVLGETPSYFRSLYPDRDFPTNMLLPPCMLLGLPRAKARLLSRPDLEARCAQAFEASTNRTADAIEIARIYLFAWLDAPSYEGLLRALHQILPQPPEELVENVRWLGNHSPADDSG